MENQEKHLRKYFLFNYENDFRTMLDNNLIGLRNAERDLSAIYNALDPSHELDKVLTATGVSSNAEKNMFQKFLFDMNLGDAVCLIDSKSIWAVGIIESNYQFNYNKELPHARKVKWLSTNKIDFEDGNHRIRIREVEKEETHQIIEEIINEALLNEDDNGLLINYPSRVTVERYLAFFKRIHFNPHEVEFLNIIYQSQPNGISIFELQKSFDGINVEETIEILSRKISRRFNLPSVEGRYSPNLFNGVLIDGHLCLVLKNELSKALVKANIVSNTFDNTNEKYTVKNAIKDSVYPTIWFEEALALLKSKRNLLILGDWGTGKSYFARRLAFLLMGHRTLDNILHIKLHSSLTYEKLMVDESSRILYRFIEKARNNSMDDFVIIFEGCHQMDLENSLGEISYLFEDNNREREAALDVIFDDKKYYIPNNIFTISTARNTPNLFSQYDLSNILIFELYAIYDNKFINMFEDINFGTWIAQTFSDVNKILEKYNFSINHGLFLKKGRGVNLEEYNIVVRYKIDPILKRLLEVNDYQKIKKLINKNLKK
ncbi:hypothetical protein LJB88_00085 [Erysipelotrichaceae bacterium OttesenSCG-928-M19]|nr:hypothetical protein [Erysipelotrichaceae bacterium OttesenSCG-928-M19]